MDEGDLRILRRCVELAAEALDAGDEPFGSVLVDVGGAVLREARNTVAHTEATGHPEFELARWAGAHLAADERATATVYTSGEHCPMCSAAHAWVGLGRIVYAGSAAQLSEWRAHWGSPPSPVRGLAITDVAPGIAVSGPAAELTDELRALHRRLFEREHPER